MEFIGRIKSLKSVWGALTGLTIIFPGASYLLNLSRIRDSVLSRYFIGCSTVFSLLLNMYILSFIDLNKKEKNC